jgi:hypothetical protein
MLNNVLKHKGELNNVENIPYFSVIKHGKKKCKLNALTLWDVGAKCIVMFKTLYLGAKRVRKRKENSRWL